MAARRRAEPELHQACLAVMREVLALPSELCQISALHGLNHWLLQHRVPVEGIIDEFVHGAVNITPRIREYASFARKGVAQ